MSRIGRNFITVVAPAHTPAVTNGMVDLAPNFVVSADELKGATFIAPNVGSASTGTVTFAGTYVAGDEIKVTIVSNATSRSLWRKTYTHIVVAGSTSVTAIATAVKNMIASDGLTDECPYNATSAVGVVTVTAKNDDKRSLNITGFTNSAAGTVAVSAISTTISEGQPSDLADKGVAADLITLASYDTVRINYKPKVAQPHIDSEGTIEKEIYWYGTPLEGAALVTLINAL
jgi:phage tail sheath gpL-like